jgi:hypothetical protein
MTEKKAFRQTQTGLIKRKSHYRRTIYMYPDRTGYIETVKGKFIREASCKELCGFNNWIPAEDGFEEESNE